MLKNLLLIITFISFLGGTTNKSIVNHKTNVTSSMMYNIYTIKSGEMSFGVSETKPKDSDFYINSNFFTTESAIGLVVIERKRKSNRVKSGGYFYVKNGKPFVSSKECPRMTEYASQTILWGIDNGVINSPLTKTSHANEKRYRTLMGQNKEGDIIIISSNRIGFVTIGELLDFSKNYGIIDGILLDGGTSVDYKFTDDNETVSFSSVPENLKGDLGIKKPTTYIYGNFN